MKHSPTPWTLGSMDDFAFDTNILDAIIDANGEPVVYFDEGIHPDILDDIRFIVACVNAFDLQYMALRETGTIGVWVELLRLGGVSVPSEIDKVVAQMTGAFAAHQEPKDETQVP